jgi:hypothetical protein
MLMLLVFGFIDFGRMFNTQMQLNTAAREGARTAAAQRDPNLQVQAGVRLTGVTTTADVSGHTAGSACDSPAGVLPVDMPNCICSFFPTAGDTVVIHANYTFKFVTPLGQLASLLHLANPDPSHSVGMAMTGKGVMQCVG